MIAENLKKRGWSLGWASAVDSKRRAIWIVEAHRDDGKRFVVRSDEKLTAFLELEAAIFKTINRMPLLLMDELMKMISRPLYGI